MPETRTIDPILDVAELSDGSVARGEGRQDHWFALTLAPGTIPAGIGATADDVWISDAIYTFYLLSASEQGTGATPSYRDFEVELEINGNELSNRPVSARALSAQWGGRRLTDLLEGRGLAIARGERIGARFINVDAGAAIDPKLHLIGHRGLPKDWKQGAVAFVNPNVRPYAEVLRDPDDAAVPDAATLDASHEFQNCFSFARLTCANREDTTGEPVDWDVQYRLNGQTQTRGSLSTALKERLSSRALCQTDREGLDLSELLGRPQVMDVGDVVDLTFLNNSGGPIRPRLIYLGHLGKPFGTWDASLLRLRRLEKQLAALKARLAPASAATPAR